MAQLRVSDLIHRRPIHCLTHATSPSVQAVQTRYFDNLAELMNNHPTPSILPNAGRLPLKVQYNHITYFSSLRLVPTAASGTPISIADLQAAFGGMNADRVLPPYLLVIDQY